jgi:hypothetical protein
MSNIKDIIQNSSDETLENDKEILKSLFSKLENKDNQSDSEKNNEDYKDCEILDICIKNNKFEIAEFLIENNYINSYQSFNLDHFLRIILMTQNEFNKLNDYNKNTYNHNNEGENNDDSEIPKRKKKFLEYLIKNKKIDFFEIQKQFIYKKNRTANITTSFIYSNIFAYLFEIGFFFAIFNINSYINLRDYKDNTNYKEIKTILNKHDSKENNNEEGLNNKFFTIINQNTNYLNLIKFLLKHAIDAQNNHNKNAEEKDLDQSSSGPIYDINYINQITSLLKNNTDFISSFPDDYKNNINNNIELNNKINDQINEVKVFIEGIEEFQSKDKNAHNKTQTNIPSHNIINKSNIPYEKIIKFSNNLLQTLLEIQKNNLNLNSNSNDDKNKKSNNILKDFVNNLFKTIQYYFCLLIKKINSIIEKISPNIQYYSSSIFKTENNKDKQ